MRAWICTFISSFLILTGLSLSTPVLADPDIPEPPKPGELPDHDDLPKPPPPGELPGDDDDDDGSWWDPLGLFDDDDDDDHPHGHKPPGHEKHDKD